jgi:rhodanese-related sulfurtransferase
MYYVLEEDAEMRNKQFKKYMIFGIIVLLFGLTIGQTVNATKIGNEQLINTTDDDDYMSIMLGGYTDISAQEAWDMLNDPSQSNGIQIPIDVRTDLEWHNERIDTPYPEDPRHYSLSDLQNENGLQEFLSLYNGSEIILSCKSGGRSSSAASILVSSEFNGTIYNLLGGITSWKVEGFPTKLGNEPPYQPDEPSGPSTGITEFSYQFSTGSADPDNDTIKYGWDWDGDDIIDDWTNYYPSATYVNISHSWTLAGTYTVKVIAEDSVGDQSDFSSELTVMIVDNIPPDAPDIIGTLNGKAGKEYDYTFVTTDPNEDDVSYYIEWGDESVEDWSESYESDENFITSHTWDAEGTYTIRVKARDIHGAESDWSNLEVSMPRNKIINLFERFLENHPKLFPLLRQLLKL